MITEFKLPELGENIESADIAEIKISEGDTIEPEQIVMELETEKAVVELPCPHGGTVSKLHVAEGDTAKVGAILFTLSDEVASKDSDEVTEKADGSDGEPTAPEVASDESPTEKADEKPKDRKKGDKKARKAEKKRTQEPAKTQDQTRDDVPPPAGPATRRMARELGVDLHNVNGSGKGGRITPEDVQAYVRNALSSVSTNADEGSAIDTPPLPDFSQWGEIERKSLNKIAKSSARNLSISWRTIPHVTQHDLADVTELEADRKRFMAKVGKDGPKITMTAVIIKAVVAALEEFPHFNSSYDATSNELILKKYFHIGVAVDTPHGLLVPVVQNAGEKSILEIASELTDLAERARQRKLSLDEMQGATFTVTNLGGIGGIGFTPIVNHPEVAILGVSRGRKELQLVEDELQERLLLPLSLSYDHRVINGADAARFVVKLCRDLSDSFQLLIEA